MPHQSSSAYFGYGSLVNALTWSEPFEHCEAVLANWVREWKHVVDTKKFGRVCTLTASPCPGRDIDGILVMCSPDQLAKVDEREIGYCREAVHKPHLRPLDEKDPDDVWIYRSSPECYQCGTREYPILMSYLECVAYGFLSRFGADAVDRFIQTTRGWSTPILDDREGPIYPRAHHIPPAERKVIDAKVRAIDGITVFGR